MAPQNPPDVDEASITEDEVNDWNREDEKEEEEEQGGAPSPSTEAPVTISNKYADSQLRIVRQTMDFPLQHLKSVLSNKDYINVSPSYQRRHRWDSTRRSQLIESFLMNIPVPPVFLFETEYNRYEVMDGLQRLETINDYLTNRFPLRGLIFWKEIQGMRFNDLPQILQSGLLRRTLNAIVLLAETKQQPADGFDIRMILFRRLNTGGIRLNPQELRNAIYQGEFNQMLQRIARSEAFCDAWGIPKVTQEEKDDPTRLPQALLKNSIYNSMADCELVLRVFAIEEALRLGFGGSPRSLMDKAMRAHAGATPTEAAALEKRFHEWLSTIINVLGAKAFCLPKSNRQSRALYDALMVAAAALQKDKIAEPAVVRSRLDSSLARTEEYELLIGRKNTMEAIRERVKVASGILQKA